MIQARFRGSLLASLFYATHLLLSTGCFAAVDADLAALPQQTLALQQQAISQNLAQSQVWQALLHTEQEQPRITDPHFLLSHQSFSLQHELQQNIVMMQTEPETFQCRFPARDVWLRQQLRLPNADYSHCAGLQEFMDKAPMDTLSVIYAAENLNSASSMMGHVLFKLSGQTADGRQRDHAISFYTEVKGVNIPKILYDSVIRGKEGYFALSPYFEKIQYYTQTEQRNVWIYDLDLNTEQRRIIQYHLWELRQTKLRYFFTKYNCATFSQLILALSNRPALMPTSAWKSPLDLVKQIHQAHLVARTQFYPSARARVRMLSEHETSTWKHDIANADATANMADLPPSNDTTEQYRILKTAQAYARYQQETANEPRTTNQLQFNRQIEAELRRYEPEFSLDLNDYKNPTKAPADSQWYIDYQNFSQQPEQIRVGGFAASHRLEDDQSQALNDSELRLLDVAVAWQPHQNRFSIEHFDLYAMTSFVPYDPLTGGLSTRIKMGYAPRFDAHLAVYKAAYIQAGLGRSYTIANDLNVYGMLNTTADYGDAKAHVEVTPELGMIVHAVYGMKSILSLSYIQSLTQQQQGYYELGWTHAIPVNANNRLVLEYRRRGNGSDLQYETRFGFKHLF